MTSQPQQEHVRWFGRSEDDPNRLLIIEDDHCRVFLDAELREELYAVIRSRHATAPEIRVACCAMCPCREPNCEDDCKEYVSQKEHDAAVAAQARKEVLNKLVDLILENPPSDDGLTSLNRIAGQIESLRESRP